jgi:OmpA-OmpF porin, OOP family
MQHHAKRWQLFLAILAAVALGACATTHPEVERARSLYDQAAADPMLAQHASVALYEAEKEVERAERTWSRDSDREEAKHIAKLAEKRLELARVMAEAAVAEQETQRLAQEREGVLLEARAREVGSALAHAEAERARAEERARVAEEARAEAEEAAERVRKLQEELAELEARQTERGIVLTLGDVLFDFDRAELRSGAQQNLARLVQFLKEHPEREVIVEGHTDSVGSATYNLGLSERRANAVVSFLVDNGIERKRLLGRGYSQTYPVVSNETAEGRQRNRRVEVVILDPGERAVERARPVPSPGG